MVPASALLTPDKEIDSESDEYDEYDNKDETCGRCSRAFFFCVTPLYGPEQLTEVTEVTEVTDNTSTSGSGAAWKMKGTDNEERDLLWSIKRLPEIMPFVIWRGRT